MKRMLQTAMCAALLCAGAQAFADDAMHKDDMSMSKKDMMAKCMKEQSAMNSSMSKTDMKKACDEKMMKMQKDHDSMMKDKPSS